MAVPRQFLIALSVALVTTACGRSEGGSEDAVGSEPTGKASPAAVAAPSNGSIMRPSVVEEVERAEPMSSPPPQPLRAEIGFPNGGVRLDDEARATLDALVARPEFAGAGRITLRGHTDSEGSDQANLAASRRRADAVRDYLNGLGVAGSRITVVALGERRPVAPNAELDGSDSEIGRRRNRRVELEVAPPVEMPPGAEPDRSAAAADAETHAAPEMSAERGSTRPNRTGHPDGN